MLARASTTIRSLAPGAVISYSEVGGFVWWAKAHFFVGGFERVGFRRGGTERRVEPRSCDMTIDLERIRAIAERVATSEGFYLLDVELKGGRSNPLLRIYIDKPKGISHADCQLVSEQVSAILDIEDLFPGSYTLEVSSPGLDRKLVKPSDFSYFAGRRARLVLREPIEKQRVFEGRLAGIAGGRVRLDVGEGALREFEILNISKAHLVVEL